MPDNTFADRLCKAIIEKKSVLCCGLDPQIRYMPPPLVRRAIENHGRTFEAVGWLFTMFNRAIIDAVADIVPVVKPQLAFYEAYGPAGLAAFADTVAYAKNMGLLVVADAKRGDGGDTADAYADTYLGQVPFFGEGDDPMALTTRWSQLRVDCMTVHGYIGEDCVMRFINRGVKLHGTGIFVVTKTSFKPNSRLEQLETSPGNEEQGVEPTKVWQELAKMVSEWGAGTEGACGLRNVGVVMGATYPTDAPKMREILPNSIFLIPGFGGQGATADDAVTGIRPDGLGGIVNDSRRLLYAWQDKKGAHQCAPEKYADAARLTAIDGRDALMAALKKANKWPHG